MKRPDDTHGDFSAGHDWRLGRFPNLMPRRVESILLVSSPYDSFILEEDGLLSELIFSEYTDLGLTHAPSVHRVSTGHEALGAVASGEFDLVIAMARLGGMEIHEFASSVKAIQDDVPVVLLAANEAELTQFGAQIETLTVDGIYVWHGDAKLFLAIIKTIEDRWNAQHDTHVGGVGVIILIEDSVRYLSSYLPLVYSELVRQTRAVMLEGINRMHKLLRLRARPKVLVATTFEEGLALYEKFRTYIFGIITDVRYPRGGEVDPQAGAAFIRKIKEDNPDIPSLLQSAEVSNREIAERLNTAFLHKWSTTLLQDLRLFMLNNFGFGDFIFRLPSGQEVARASNLYEMRRVLRDVPAESLDYHASRNHFSNWLRARTEFVLARKLRPRKVSEFGGMEGLRAYLIQEVDGAIRQNRRGVVEDFTRERFGPGSRLTRIGGGSLGGKARGLAFFDAMLERYQLHKEYEDVSIFVPRSVMIGTDVFDEFLDNNQLRTLALYKAQDEWIRQAFLKAVLPRSLTDSLSAYLAHATSPLAVRSSSTLEDSPYHPFAGVFSTIMLPNNHTDSRQRLSQLCDAIKLVYASTFYEQARQYLRATPHRIEEQKMGVMLMEVVGTRHDHYYYPSFAGVARSYNFYPFGHMKPEDGVATVALGLGQCVVEGSEALRFSPGNPHVLPQLSLGKAFISNSQRCFYAINLDDPDRPVPTEELASVERLDLTVAEKHGTLDPVASVWSHENEAFYDGIYRPGARVVTFAHILKSDLFPLAGILSEVLDLGRIGFAGPVELEFAVNLSANPRQFAVLQIRPFGVTGEQEAVEIDGLPDDLLLVSSEMALGNGIVDGLHDIVYVKPDTFDAATTPAIAAELGKLNETLLAEKRRVLLIGPGRWGSSNPWLGIPVNWAQISAARVIVETSLEHFKVDSSQGSHFFHNLTSLGVGYLTVDPELQRGFIDWHWLDQQPCVFETDLLRHVRVDIPLEARMDGRQSRAAVLKWSVRAEGLNDDI
ncbi:MAG: hypothetical protein KDA32_09250 [Phycisphaerales bacterium]|nr:hypothetical protein [Phycisphaerales bacterium]